MSSEVFKTVPSPQLPHSVFDLSHNRKLSGRIGELIPVLCEEVMPGDEFRISSEVFCRLAPMISPIMHKIDIFVHGFFVPTRLLYELYHGASGTRHKWEDFLSGKESHMMPQTFLGNETIVGSLADHLGIPVGTWTNADGNSINACPFIAYAMIWEQYYRDENLENEVDYDSYSTASDWISFPLKMRAWEKDYFTSAWPFAQKGIASAAVIDTDLDTGSKVWLVGGTVPADGYPVFTSGELRKDGPGGDIVIESELHLDISELRRANVMQIWMERTARAGSRLTELLRGHFGVWPKDERLQRPEYIGGGVFPLIISDVTSTSGFASATGTPDATVGQPLPMGTMAGKGVGYGNSNMMYKRAEEHGYIMVILSVRPEAVYFQGLHRKFNRKTYLDLPWPEFANLGEQEVLNKEIYYKDLSDANAPNDLDALFGYQSRYAEFKFIPNTVHGAFRTTLDFWHMGRKFTDIPDLNDDFIHVDTTHDDLTRIFAVENSEQFYMQVTHHIQAKRPLPFFNIPSLE